MYIGMISIFEPLLAIVNGYWHIGI